jgi:hypothetical protein
VCRGVAYAASGRYSAAAHPWSVKASVVQLISSVDAKRPHRLMK